MNESKLQNIFSLEGKVIVITGAGGLLGRQHSFAVAAFGGIPILIDIKEKPLSLLKSEIKKDYSIDCDVHQIDISQEESVRINCEKVLNKFSKIDGLILNAANNPKIEENNSKNFSRLENFSIENWEDDLNVGLTGSFLCAKYYGHAISKNKNGGSIVSISSDLGIIAPDQNLYIQDDLSPEMQPVKPITYSVVKSGIIGLTRYLSTYWPDNLVRANALCPGGVNNNQSEQFLNRIKSRIPLSRMAEVDEYQGTLIWMLSDASSYLNGAIIPVDGGRTAW